MPQFDHITFFNQIFWTLLIFLIFYFYILKNYLPGICLNLKTRKKKLLNANILISSSEQSNILPSAILIVDDILTDLRFILGSLNINTQQWLNYKLSQTIPISTVYSQTFLNLWNNESSLDPLLKNFQKTLIDGKIKKKVKIETKKVKVGKKKK
jgi:hypothetical protein